ncbi:site-specific integrase [Saccharopolyspora sp. ASAGF58]|uniref:tyrosine-type recombinase/integrase n=1 Tax=Saccharopolyspora sp. ASAGF58 TaxID=2719023 RepID=UPI00144030FD|nr:site-specific integrase [Saccharopolyspora sp. ASAGF58]QIZ35913.1 site-specific integrase [Saccharopolyspora sp. ASAGF58]
MGTVTELRSTPAGVTVGEAVRAFETHLRTTPINRAGDRYASAHTVRAYTTAVGLVLPAAMPVAELATGDGALRLRTAFTDRWGTAAVATRNAKRAALLKFVDYCQGAGLLDGDADPMAGIDPAGTAASQPRTRPRTGIDALLADTGHGLRERALWALAYESYARAEELLQLNVENLNLRNRSARTVGKGGDEAVIMWDVGAARLLARLVRGRASGPVFLTERRGKGEATGQIERGNLAGDGRKRLSYDRALQLLKAASGGWTLHDLRHSGISHALEDGVPMPVVMAKSRHRDLASFRRYANPSLEYAQRQVEQARRRSQRGGPR